MTGTLNPTCSLCGLRFANRPLLELHIREDHPRRDHPAEPDHDARATKEVITMTTTRQPRPSRPGWTRTALRRAIGALRDLNQELVRGSEAIFRSARTPLPHPRPDTPAGQDTDRAA